MDSPPSSLGAQGKRTTVPKAHDHDIFTLHLVMDVGDVGLNCDSWHMLNGKGSAGFLNC